MNTKPSRTTVNHDRKMHNEGARLLWLAMQENGRTQAGLAAEIGAASGIVSKWLHCDRRPGLKYALAMQRELGIPTEAWHETPNGAVVPATARKRPRAA